MPGKGSKNHTHKYHKITLGYDTKVWACALEDCTHYMPQHMENFVPGKVSLCWSCGEKFRLTNENMVNEKPICDKCTLEEKGIDTNIFDEVSHILNK